MKLLVFSIFDVKVGAYMAPFFSPAIGHACRSFGDAVGDAQSQLSKHPEDYRLFHLGSFDDQVGEFEDGGPRLVAEGTSFVVRQEAREVLRRGAALKGA